MRYVCRRQASHDSMRRRFGSNEADDGAHQHRLAAAGRPHQTQGFRPRRTSSVEMVEHDLAAEADHKIAAREWRTSCGHGIVTFRSRQRTSANRPSSTMTRKIDLTTEDVVCCPSDSALPFTRKPSLAGDEPDHQRHERRLDSMPTSKW